MVIVTVLFQWEGQRWSHFFKLEEGATVLRLKELMLGGRGGQQDLDSFELRQRGRRVPNAERIFRDHSLEFEFLGAAEGGRRAQLDRSQGARLEGQRRQEPEAKGEAQTLTLEKAPCASTEVEEELLVPNPATRPPGPGPPAPRWKVVGGGAAGGLLVREEEATTSQKLPERLGTGAVVEELEAIGGRLHYRKLSGTGPQEGWVSLSLSGRYLLARQELSAEEAFSLDRALSFQEELMWAFARREIQRELAALVAEKASLTKAQLAKRRSELYLKVQAPVLVRYGFEGSTAGLLELLRVLKASGLDRQEAVVWNAEQIDALTRKGQL